MGWRPHIIALGLVAFASPVLIADEYDVDAIIALAKRANNGQLRLVEMAYDKGIAQVGALRSGALPQLNLNVRGSKLSRSNISGIPGSPLDRAEGKSYDWNLTLTQPIITFGKLGTVWQMAKEQENLLRVKKSWDANSYLAEVLNSYAAAIIAQDEVLSAEKSKNYYKSLFQFAEVEFKGGAQSKIDYLRIKSAYHLAGAAHATSQADFKNKTNQLRSLLGLQKDVKFALNPRRVADVKFLKENNMTDRRRRADIKLKQAELEVAQLKTNYRHANYWPSISFFASAGAAVYDFPGLPEDVTFSDAFSSERTDYAVGLSFDWQLFDGLKTTSEYHEAVADEAILREELSRMRNNEEAEYQYAKIQVIASKRAFEAAKAAAEASELAFAVAEENYKSGLIGLTDLFNYEKEAKESAKELSRAYAQWLIAVSGYKLVSGKGI